MFGCVGWTWVPLTMLKNLLRDCSSHPGGTTAPCKHSTLGGWERHYVLSACCVLCMPSLRPPASLGGLPEGMQSLQAVPTLWASTTEAVVVAYTLVWIPTPA
uniref:Uncharacterized protein n=1 Tax=Eutreptiella gymnastica TaxID=73025 RepID=A0A7S1JFB5_9EUGL